MKMVHKTMNDRCQYQGSRDNEYQARIKSIETGEDFAGNTLRRIDRTHATEQHRRVQKPIDPGQLLEVLISDHSKQE